MKTPMIRFIKRHKVPTGQEPQILDHGDPVTTRLTREIEERKYRLSLSQPAPVLLPAA